MAIVFSSDLFNFSKRINLLAADISTLAHNAGNAHVFSPIEAGHGLQIKSQATNEIATFTVDYVDTTEGEIQGWNLRPTQSTIRRLPHLSAVKLLIVND